MNIVTGSGNRRSVLGLPHASVVKAAPAKDQKQALEIVCSLLKIPLN